MANTSQKDPAELVDHFFRHEQGRAVATLARTLGSDKLDLAEESVQEACLRALRTWPFRGLPQDPAAWIFRTARNHALDLLRRTGRFGKITPELTSALESLSETNRSPDAPKILDDQLELIGTCCHPQLSQSAQVALTLKLACGFNTREIGRAFHAQESAVAQRIVRAKKLLREHHGSLSFEGEIELGERLESILSVLYLLFNEGYSSMGRPPIRGELVGEAIRLVQLLGNHPASRRPHVFALESLFLFQASRLDARLDARGAMVPLEEQDRGLWDRSMIDSGLRALECAGTGTTLSEFHLLAAIAACHATAPSVEETDWARILSIYDEIALRGESWTLAVSRAIARSHVDGPESGIDALYEIVESMAKDPTNSAVSSHVVDVAFADCHRRLGSMKAAKAHYSRALERVTNDAERLYLEKRLRES